MFRDSDLSSANDDDIQTNGTKEYDDHQNLSTNNSSEVSDNDKMETYKVNGLHKDKMQEDDDDGGPCGWGKFQPSFCQRFRSPRWYLAVITLCGVVQGMAINGFLNTCISTIERRFAISSTEAGLIASCYDISFVLMVIPISYFGGMGNKPRYLGIGIFVLGIGSFVFSLPHFISNEYSASAAKETVCDRTANMSSVCSHGESDMSSYKYFFFAGQFLHGAGTIAMYTLGVTYMDENVPQRLSAFYNGIFFTGAIIGPAIGYILGAKLLDIYTDIDIGVDPSSLGLDPQNPRWVGAWWIGFLVSGTIGVLLSLPLLAFPPSLPGSKQYAAERGQEVHAHTQNDRTGQTRGFKDMLLSIRLLMTNQPYMFINIAAAAVGGLIRGISTFMPKFIEYQYGTTAGEGALLVGLVAVFAASSSNFAGGFIVRLFDLKVRGMLRLCLAFAVLTCVMTTSLLMQCSTAPFAGVSLPYKVAETKDISFLGQKNLDDSCNSGCGCREYDYYPMCGRDGVLYFSPCYAGCTDVVQDGDIKRYTNCSCVSYNLTQDDLVKDGDKTQGQFGKCDNKCDWLPLFMVCFGALVALLFASIMPSLTTTLRCVPDHQRSFGLGIQTIVAKCLGSIPGPILFGKMFDLSCLVWQKRCDGVGSCFFYDNHEMRIKLIILAIIFSFVMAAAFFLANLFYKPKESISTISHNATTISQDTLSSTVVSGEMNTPTEALSTTYL